MVDNSNFTWIPFEKALKYSNPIESFIGDAFLRRNVSVKCVKSCSTAGSPDLGLTISKLHWKTIVWQNQKIGGHKIANKLHEIVAQQATQQLSNFT